MSPELEDEIHVIGAEIVDAFPSTARHPMKALDARALELASSDRELRTALFRFVDVVPACRSLDELARHLSGFLDELDEPPPPVSAALRVAHTRAGRAALGAAAAGGVKHMAHRFIVGETPHSALGVLRSSKTVARPVVKVDMRFGLLKNEQSVGTRPAGWALIVSKPLPPLSTTAPETTPTSDVFERHRS